MTTTQQNAATQFFEMHQGPSMLVLPNAWDAGSALLIEKCGAKSIATTSAGVAWSHGYPDGDLLPLTLLTATISAISRVIRVPLTTDMEGGYSSDPAIVAQTAAAVIDSGAVGINIEDGADTPDLLARKIEAIKDVASRSSVNLFVNARTDVMLRQLVPQPQAVDEVVKRAKRYADAGADGIFVPYIVNAADIKRVAEEVRLPLNVLARPGLPAAAELQRLGVRRLSAGSGIVQHLYGRTQVLASGFLAEGSSEPMYEGAMLYPDINQLLSRS